MKITDVQTILLTGPCTNDPYLSLLRKKRSAAFIRIKTDAGLIGLGETYAGYFFPEGVPPIVEFFKPILVGNSVDDIPALWHLMYHSGNFWCRVGLGAAVLAGIEAALWDLKGKLLGVPVYKLLEERWQKEFDVMHDSRQASGHGRLPCYATGGPSNYPLDQLAGKVDFYCSLGFRGVKLGAGYFKAGEKVIVQSDPAEAADFEAGKSAFIRDRYGKDFGLMIDAHMGNSPDVTWGLETASAVAKALEPYNLMFLEEPLHYTNPAHYSELCRQTTTPIAGGECLTAVSEWKSFIDQQCFMIGQPDASFTAGLDQFMAVALMLARQGKSLATHAWGAGGSLMQNIHAGFACPNTVILEMPPAYGPLHSEVIGSSLQIKDGFVLPPERPGLGICLTDDTIRKYPFVPGTGEFNSVPGKMMTT